MSGPKISAFIFMLQYFSLSLSVSIDEGVGLVLVPATRISVIVSVSVDGWHVPTTKISVKPYICISVSVDIYVGV